MLYEVLNVVQLYTTPFCPSVPLYLALKLKCRASTFVRMKCPYLFPMREGHINPICYKAPFTVPFLQRHNMRGFVKCIKDSCVVADSKAIINSYLFLTPVLDFSHLAQHFG
jgi:hypothetical protein